MKTFKIKSYVYSILRRGHSRSPGVVKALTLSIHPTNKGPRGGKQYVCNSCKHTFSGKDVQVDHTNPVVPVTSSIDEMDYQDIVDRMFCGTEKLQTLCKPCHKIKSKEEAKLRAINRKVKKVIDIVK